MTATDYLLTAAGDLDLTAKSRDLQYVSDVAAIAQTAACRLRLIKGEWPLDTDAGLDWDRVLGVGVTPQQIESEVRRVLLAVPGIAQVIAVDVTISSGRLATVVWTARADTDELLTGEIGA